MVYLKSAGAATTSTSRFHPHSTTHGWWWNVSHLMVPLSRRGSCRWFKIVGGLVLFTTIWWRQAAFELLIFPIHPMRHRITTARGCWWLGVWNGRVYLIGLLLLVSCLIMMDNTSGFVLQMSCSTRRSYLGILRIMLITLRMLCKPLIFKYIWGMAAALRIYYTTTTITTIAILLLASTWGSLLLGSVHFFYLDFLKKYDLFV